MKYSKLAEFILILFVSFFTFPLVCEEGDAKERNIQTLTEDSPIDIADGSVSRDDKVKPALDDFTLRSEVENVSYTSNILRLVLSLIFIVFLVYVVIRFMKKSRLFIMNDDAYLKLVAQLNIEQGKSIKVFTLGEKAYIVGVTDNNITKIAEIEDKVLIDAMNLKANEKPNTNARNFSSVFSNFFPTVKSAKTTEEKIFDDDFLKSQQERIKNMNLRNE